jgi:hypothetical protein
MFGPIAGAAVVGFILLQDYIKGTAEKLKKSTEATKEFTDVLREMRLESDKLQPNQAARELDKLAKQNAKSRTAMLEIERPQWREYLKEVGKAFVQVVPGFEVETPEERRRKLLRDDPEYQRLASEQAKIGEKTRNVMAESLKRGEGGPGLTPKHDEKHQGGTTPHILRAVHGEELGALKLEHSNPMVDLLRKIVDVETKILAVVQRPNAPRPNVIHNHPTPEVGLRLDF